MWHPGSEKPERPVFQPRDRGEVSRIRHCLTQNKSALITRIIIQGSDVTKKHISTAILWLRYYTCSMLEAKQLIAAEYFQQWNNDEGGELHSAGTLAGTRSSSHKRKPQKAIKQSRHHLQSGMTRQVSTLNVLASSQQPKTSRQDNNIALSRLIKLTSTMIQQQLLSMI